MARTKGFSWRGPCRPSVGPWASSVRDLEPKGHVRGPARPVGEPHLWVNEEAWVVETRQEHWSRCGSTGGYRVELTYNNQVFLGSSRGHRQGR